MDFNSPKMEEHMHFICPECGIELPTQIIWRKHLNNTHDYIRKTVDVFNFKEINDRYHECNECHKWVANGNQSITTLQYHRISHLPFNLTFKCKHCDIAFARKRSLCDHLYEEHKHVLNTGYNGIARADSNVTPPSSIMVQPNVGSNFEELMKRDLIKNKREHGDIIQKALLDSLIDLENETCADENKGSSDNDALNQSLIDLEAILKNDLDTHNFLAQQYTNSHQEIYQNAVPYDEENLTDIEDNELLEQICADIFEEVVEPAEIGQGAHGEQPTTKKTNSPSADVSTDFSPSKTDKTHLEPYEEKIISIEIDTVNESERRNMYSSPKRKRLKLDLPPSDTAHMDLKLKKLLETYILYLCPECGREFRTQSEWRDHVFKVHDLTNTMYAKFQALRNGKSHMCLDCRELLVKAKTQDLLRHRFTHMPFQSYLKCTFCAKTKSSKPKIMQHLQEFHTGSCKEKKSVATHFKCSHCQKAFQTYARCEAHRQSCLAAHKKSESRPTDLNVTNLNLIAHLKMMRARMRKLKRADNTEAGKPANKYLTMS